MKKREQKGSIREDGKPMAPRSFIYQEKVLGVLWTAWQL